MTSPCLAAWEVVMIKGLTREATVRQAIEIFDKLNAIELDTQQKYFLTPSIPPCGPSARTNELYLLGSNIQIREFNSRNHNLSSISIPRTEGYSAKLVLHNRPAKISTAKTPKQPQPQKINQLSPTNAWAVVKTNPTSIDPGNAVVQFSSTIAAIQRHLQQQDTLLNQLQQERTHQSSHNDLVISRLNDFEAVASNIAKSITDALTPSITDLVTKAVEEALASSAKRDQSVDCSSKVTPLKQWPFNQPSMYNARIKLNTI